MTKIQEFILEHGNVDPFVHLTNKERNQMSIHGYCVIDYQDRYEYTIEHNRKYITYVSYVNSDDGRDEKLMQLLDEMYEGKNNE